MSHRLKETYIGGSTCKLCSSVLLQCERCSTVGCRNPDCHNERFQSARCLECNGNGKRARP